MKLTSSSLPKYVLILGLVSLGAVLAVWGAAAPAQALTIVSTSATAAADTSTPAPSPSPMPTSTATPLPTATATALPTGTLEIELQATLAAGLPPTSTPDAEGMTMGGFDGVAVLPLTVNANQPPLWVAFTHGMRSFEPLQNHFVAIYSHNNDSWQELSRLELEQPDYIDPASVQQVSLEPGHIWLEVQGGAGAHAGVFDLLSFDGQTLRDEATITSQSPGESRVEDLNGDGTPDVLLDQTESYVFCYACGVRLFHYQVLSWDGKQLSEVGLTPLSESAPADLRRLNNRAVELAQAGLLKEAQQTIDQAQALNGQDKTVTWNAALIRLPAQAQAEQAQQGPYPLLDNVFYGDYEAALTVMRTYPVKDIFSQSTPLITGTVAEGWEEDLSRWITDSTTKAIEAEPDLAAAYFLRGWAAHQLDPGSSTALADIQRAADLNPKEPLFTQSVAYLKK